MTATQWGRGRIITEEASIMSTENIKSLTLNRRKTLKGVLLEIKREWEDVGGYRVGTSKIVETYY